MVKAGLSPCNARLGDLKNPKKSAFSVPEKLNSPLKNRLYS